MLSALPLADSFGSVGTCTRVQRRSILPNSRIRRAVVAFIRWEYNVTISSMGAKAVFAS